VILIATTDFGCADTATQIIEVLPEVLIYAPNSFTPDGDEFNQSWNVYMDGVDIFSFDLTIYNRWGETIWESHDIEVGWDGTYNGNIVPTGVYTWIVHVKDQINDGKYSFNGHINLLR
jgi:gliding motility-associated-like protein